MAIKARIQVSQQSDMLYADGDKVEAAPGGFEEQTHRGYANAVLSDNALNNVVENDTRDSDDFHQVGHTNGRRPNKVTGSVMVSERPAVMKRKVT